MLFTPTLLVAGGATVALACLDKTLDSYGFHTLGTALRIVLPLAALLAGVYFIETNALLGWLR